MYRAGAVHTGAQDKQKESGSGSHTLRFLHFLACFSIPASFIFF